MMREHAALARHGDLARREVDLEPAHAKLGGRRRRCGARPAKHGPHSGHELARVEGLGEIVVGAELEPDHFVHVFALGRQHDDGQARQIGSGADPSADLEAVHAREHEVEEDELGPALGERGETPGAVRGHRHVDIVLAEIFRHEGAQAGVVVDEQRGDSVGHVAILSRIVVELRGNR